MTTGTFAAFILSPVYVTKFSATHPRPPATGEQKLAAVSLAAASLTQRNIQSAMQPFPRAYHGAYLSALFSTWFGWRKSSRSQMIWRIC